MLHKSGKNMSDDGGDAMRAAQLNFFQRIEKAQTSIRHATKLAQREQLIYKRRPSTPSSKLQFKAKPSHSTTRDLHITINRKITPTCRSGYDLAIGLTSDHRFVIECDADDGSCRDKDELCRIDGVDVHGKTTSALAEIILQKESVVLSITRYAEDHPRNTATRYHVNSATRINLQTMSPYTQEVLDTSDTDNDTSYLNISAFDLSTCNIGVLNNASEVDNHPLTTTPPSREKAINSNVNNTTLTNTASGQNLQEFRHQIPQQPQQPPPQSASLSPKAAISSLAPLSSASASTSTTITTSSSSTLGVNTEIDRLCVEIEVRPQRIAQFTSSTQSNAPSIANTNTANAPTPTNPITVPNTINPTPSSSTCISTSIIADSPIIADTTSSVEGVCNARGALLQNQTLQLQQQQHQRRQQQQQHQQQGFLQDDLHHWYRVLQSQATASMCVITVCNPLDNNTHHHHQQHQQQHRHQQQQHHHQHHQQHYHQQQHQQQRHHHHQQQEQQLHQQQTNTNQSVSSSLVPMSVPTSPSSLVPVLVVRSSSSSSSSVSETVTIASAGHGGLTLVGVPTTTEEENSTTRCKQHQGVFVSHVKRASRAYNAGLVQGQRILSINHISCEGMGLVDVQTLILQQSAIVKIAVAVDPIGFKAAQTQTQTQTQVQTQAQTQTQTQTQAQTPHQAQHEREVFEEHHRRRRSQTRAHKPHSSRSCSQSRSPSSRSPLPSLSPSPSSPSQSPSHNAVRQRCTHTCTIVRPAYGRPLGLFLTGYGSQESERGAVFVYDVAPNTVAYKCGLQTGYRILSINFRRCEGLFLNEVNEMIGLAGDVIVIEASCEHTSTLKSLTLV